MPHSRYTAEKIMTGRNACHFFVFLAGNLQKVIFVHMKKILAILLMLATVFPAASQESKWAVVNVSSCFMRARPDYESGNETQCLMGTVLEVSGKERYWLRVSAPDYRDCWVNELSLVLMSEAEKDAYITAPKLICTAEHTHVFSAADESSDRICDFVMGDIVRASSATECGGWTPVILPSGREGWVRSGDVEDFDVWVGSRAATGESLTEFARRFIGVPYLWGGNTIEHFDCSGLTKFVYMMNGIVLPRNAREQIRCGVEVPFDYGKMQPGDLVFFGSLRDDGSIGSVTHVAMYIGDGRIIHSSQLVRINSLKPGLPDSYGRTPIAVRRILGHVDAGLGAVSAEVRPWYFSK